MKTKQHFYKYQSLGNDFILLDWLDKTQDDIHAVINEPAWLSRVVSWCDRHSGIGADGIVVLVPATNCVAECFIFNSDGTPGGVCLNGVRCVARFLRDQNRAPTKFSILMSGLTIPCEVNDGEIKITVTSAPSIEPCDITVANIKLEGFRVEAGNPHFIVFQKTTEDWLKQYGHLIETHDAFSNRTNVEFVWQDKALSQEMAMPAYQILIYERGCGITQACGSGAAAVMNVLFQLQKIRVNHQVILSMPGGNLISFINDQRVVIQFAKSPSPVPGFA